jgi:hypothetical protein
MDPSKPMKYGPDPNSSVSIGVRRGVSKGVEDDRRSPALKVGHR